MCTRAMTALTRGAFMMTNLMGNGFHQVVAMPVPLQSAADKSLGTPAYSRFVAVATERTILAGIVRLSQSAQTSSLEVFS